MRIEKLVMLLSAALAGCAAAPPPVAEAKPDPAKVAQEVADTERAFAASMAKRDFAAFEAFLSEEAVFFSGKKVLHGKKEVAEAWRRFFEKPEAPFSWEPETVEPLPSGTLSLSTGPVRNPSGKVVATFSSIWRREADGKWRIVFDKGNDVCDCGPAAGP